MTTKSTLICATAIAIALTSFDLRPAAAAPEGGPAIAKQNAGVDEISAQRRNRRRGVHPGVPLAAFGAIAGTIAGIAAANSRRDYYERQYYAPGYYGGPAYGYYAPPAYQYHEAPVYQRRGYYEGHQGYGGHQGYVGHHGYRGGHGQGGGQPAPVDRQYHIHSGGGAL
jgi:hypothetical protein